MEDNKAVSDTNLMNNIMWIGKSRVKAVYYRPDGSKTLPLPADPWNKAMYLGKGLTLEPKGEDNVEISGIKCPYCDFEPKNALGLRTHLNTHVGKNKEGE